MADNADEPDIFTNLPELYNEIRRRAARYKGVLIFPEDLEDAAEIQVQFLWAQLGEVITVTGEPPLGGPVFDPFVIQDLMLRLFGEGVERVLRVRIREIWRHPKLLIPMLIAKGLKGEDVIKWLIWSGIRIRMTAREYVKLRTILPMILKILFYMLAVRLRPNKSGPRKHRMTYSRPLLIRQVRGSLRKARRPKPRGLLDVE